MTAANVRFAIDTAMAEALLGRAAEAGILLTRVERPRSHRLILWVRAADEPRLIALLEQYSLSYRVTGRAGRARGREFLRRRAALVVSLLIAGAALIGSAGRVWSVSVSGALAADEAGIRETLAQSGARPGCVKGNLDFPHLRRVLEAKFPDYAFFGVKTLGVVLFVDAVRADEAPEIYRIDDSRDLVADADGVVLTVHAAAGQALVKPGDSVRRGDVLIRGAERVSVSGDTAPVRAEGSVVARLWTEGAASVPLARETRAPTGRKAVAARLETPFFSRVLAGENPFADWTEESTESDIVGLFLPVKVRRTVYVETVYIKEEIPTKIASAAAEALALARARRNAPPGASEVRTWTEHQTDGGRLTARAVVEWTKEIARGAQGG